MKLSIRHQLRPTDRDLVSFSFEESALPEGVSQAEFQGKLLSHCLTREGDRRTLHVGLGKTAEATPDRYRKAAAVASRLLRRIGARQVAFQLGENADVAGAVVDGALSGAYLYEDFLPLERRSTTKLSTLVIIVASEAVSAARTSAKQGFIIGESVNYVRHIGNQPPNVIFPESLAQEAKRLAEAEDGITCRVLNATALKRQGFGGLLAVGGGSEKPPVLIELTYRGAAANTPPLAIVGKAITFDTGGISLKPGEAMDEMKFDKMGGCAVLGIMRAVAQLKLPVNVTALIASAENMPGSRAYRPGDIVTTYDGQTIEVLNTDAEGRIVLADALGYARTKVKPSHIIDLATLTGACLVALGTHRSGLFTDHRQLSESLVSVGEATGDRVWPLPVGEEYDRDIISDIASVKNTGGRWGGASTAASFLQHWVGDIPWAHLDIAGTGWLSTAKDWAEKGATGAGVRLVTGWIEQFAHTRKPKKS